MNAPARRLAVYRAWLIVNVALATFLVLLAPPLLYGTGIHNPAAVLPTVAVLLAWWGSFVGAWCAGTRLPRGNR